MKILMKHIMFSALMMIFATSAFGQVTELNHKDQGVAIDQGVQCLSFASHEGSNRLFSSVKNKEAYQEPERTPFSLNGFGIASKAEYVEITKTGFISVESENLADRRILKPPITA